MRLPPGLRPNPAGGLPTPPDPLPSCKRLVAWPPCCKIVPAPLQHARMLSQEEVVLGHRRVMCSGRFRGGQGARAPPFGKVKKCKRAPLTENDVFRSRKRKILRYYPLPPLNRVDMALYTKAGPLLRKILDLRLMWVPWNCNITSGQKYSLTMRTYSTFYDNISIEIQESFNCLICF